jgi:hypothetical protein
MTFYKPRRRRQRHPIEQETAIFVSSEIDSLTPKISILFVTDEQ